MRNLNDTVVPAAPRRSATRLDCRALPVLPEPKEPPLRYLDSATTSFLADSEPSAQESARRTRSFVRKLDELDRCWKCSPKKQCIDDVKEHTEQPALVLVPDPPATMAPAMQLSAEASATVAAIDGTLAHSMGYKDKWFNQSLDL